ncbi:hypothetical protein L195_g020361 [Trifolium pratense]|uniref:Uncharacterized protein n=1 Tax=Trifolium pratense TaxID=57577 RepID=A0A2K3N262_TRIPR|nr:hypothetical protein L195_g020361 [Trifolium pratense]
MSPPFEALPIPYLPEITLSRVWSETVIPVVSKSATTATAASSSPRSRQREITSSYSGLQHRGNKGNHELESNKDIKLFVGWVA